MKPIYFLTVCLATYVVFSTAGCNKKEETTTSTNMTSEVVANLNAISANYSPDSLASASTRLAQIKSDPCQGVSDFAVCQSNLIREYNSIGQSVVETITQLVSSIGTALGSIPDGNAGSSTDGKVAWNKVDGSNWSIIVKSASMQTQAYVSISGTSYTLKFDMNNHDSYPRNQQIEATVNFTNSNSWNVDVFFSNLECETLDPAEPNKLQLKVGFDGTLWTGKAMIYAGRWKAPGATVTCATTYGDAANEITMYTDYVGNDSSTKASLYMIPATNNNLTTIANFDLEDFCSNFATNCDGVGEPTAVALAAYPNPWCTTGPNTTPTWNSTCPSNPNVTGASYSSAANWITPATLKAKTVSLPSSL